MVTGSINAGVLMDRGVQHLLPITVYGLKKFNRLQSLSDFSGQQIVNPAPFLVLHVGIKGSDVLAKEGNIPLVMDRKLGNGKIVFLSFDPHSPPFIRLMSNPGFWKKILMASSKSDPKPMMLPAQRILQVMLASTKMRFPGYWFAGLSIFLYLLLFWICVKKLNNSKWRSVRYLFLAVIFFSFASIGYFLFSSPKNASYNSFCRINLTEKNANSDGEYILGLYSTGEEPYDLSFTEFPMPVRHVISENSTQKIPSPYRIKQKGPYSHIVGLSGKWSYSFYIARPRFEFPVLADVEADGEHLNVMIENKTPYEIVDCLIFYNQRFHKIKDIASESKESRMIAKSLIDLQKAYDPGEPKSMNIRGTMRESTFFNTMKNNLKDDLRSAVHAAVDVESDEKTVYITGWIKADILKPSFAQKDIAGEGLTLISWKGKI